MYEPSKELIEQIAKEECDFELGCVGAYENSFAHTKEYYTNKAIEMCNQPTVLKALELYENQPKWQDKPDKEGWWWVFSLYVRGDPLIFPLYPIHILFCDGELHADTSYPEEFPSISNYIKTLSNPKWLYIPEPYKGEE